jgi:uncharacterized iron-regulated membrane protein
MAGAGMPVAARRGRRSGRDAVRRTADTIHKWLGFLCGAALLVAGLTGTLLAFYMELDGALNPRLRTPSPHARPASYEAVYQRLRTVPVGHPGYWKIEIPPDGGPITSRFYEQHPNDMSRTRMVTLDPGSLQVMRDAFWRDTFFTWLYDLHMNLLFGPPGKIFMGILSVGMIVMLIAGLLNWALPKGTLRSKLKVKHPASLPRRTYDLHKIAGLVTFPLLLLVVGTAAIICLPNQAKPLINTFSPLTVSPDQSSHPIPGKPRIPVDAALALGPKAFPGSTVVWVRVPARPTDSYNLQIRQAGDPMTRFPKTHVWIDQYSGAVLQRRDPHRDSAGDTVLNWVVPLHDGKAFGMIGRVLVLFLGLFPLVLFVTGTMRWLQKRAARLKSASRHRMN